MSINTEDSNYGAFIVEEIGVITEINNSFLELSGFVKEEILNKSFEDVVNNLLCINLSTYEENVKKETFLFTKSLDARNVLIEKVECAEFGKVNYFIEEIPNSRFEKRNEFLERLIVENKLGIGVFSVPDFKLIRANDRYLSNLPSEFNTKKKAYGKIMKDIIPGFSGSNMEKVWVDSTLNDKPVYFEERQGFINNDNNKYWDCKLIPVSLNGRVKYIVAVLDDVTERVMSREHIRNQWEIIQDQNNQLEAIIDNISEELYIIDSKRNYLKLNKAARNRYSEFKFNDSAEYICKYKLYDQSGDEIHIDKTPVARLARGECIKDEIVIVYDPNKRYVCTNGKPIFDEQGNFTVGVLLSQDITAKVIQEGKIKYQNEQLRAIINSMSDGLELVHSDMKVTFLNHSAKDFFYNPETKKKAGDSLKYNKYYYGIDGEEIPRDDLPALRIFKKGNFENYILTIDRPDKKIYASINGSQIYNNGTSATEAILCIRDITDQVMQENAIKFHQEKAFKAERERSEALEKTIEMKDEFLSIISHEFKTPLNVISTAIQAMKYLCKDELSERSQRYINTIRQNTFRQLRLVNNLLDITRADAGRIKIHKKNLDIVFLTKSITDSVISYASQKGVSITFLTSIKKRIIGIDDEKYERILLNLLSNAIKFTPEGKSIIVKLHTVKGNICIEVKDSGIGIPKDKLKVIFERFGQVDSSLSRQAEGAGIGLSLVKKLIEALGGSIYVKSKEGKGSSFIINLPNETTPEENNEKPMIDLMDNRLIQTTTVEFSDIYL